MSSSWRGRVRPIGIGAAILALALLASFGAVEVAPAVSTAQSKPPQLIVNGNFSAGTQGWRVNRAETSAFVVDHTGRSGSLGARITAADEKPMILSNAASVVRYTNAGTRYDAILWVRSSRPGVTATIRVTEKNPRAAVRYSQKSVRLVKTSWQKLTVTATSARSGGTLDLSLRFSGSRPGERVHVDDVSFKAQASAERTPDASPSPRPGRIGTCTRPAPPQGTQFGTSISTSSTIWAADALRDRDEKFGRIAAVRIWDEPMPMPWRDQRTAHLAGRTLVMSFRPAPSEVLAGTYDAELRRWFEEAPSTSTIYWSYVHEPETPIDDQHAFSASEYRRAWQHIDGIADAVCRQNMFSTLILMGWTVNPASKKDWRDYYAGDDVIDVLAFDPYNGVHDPERDHYATAERMMGDAVAVSKASGKPWAISEIGSRLIASDPTGVERGAWLTEIADYARANGALFVTYFQSSRDGEWRLLDRPSQEAWRAAIASSR